MPSRSHRRPPHNESGQAMTEYIIVIILVALAVMFSMGRFPSALGRKFGCASAKTSEFDVDDAKFPRTAGGGGGLAPGKNPGAGGDVGAGGGGTGGGAARG